MKKLFSVLIILLLIPLSLIANDKITVAVIDFQTESINQNKINVIMDYFVDALTKTNQFIVVERQRISLLINQQRIESSDLFSERTAVQIGNLTGSSLIIIGNINFFDNKYYLTIRAVDIENGIIRFSETAETNEVFLLRKVVDLANYSSFHYIDQNKSVDFSVGGSVLSSFNTRVSMAGDQYYSSVPISLSFGVGAPVSVSYNIKDSLSIGGSFFIGYSFTWLTYAHFENRNLFTTSIAGNELDFRTLFKLRYQSQSSNVKFIFEPGISQGFLFIWDNEQRITDGSDFTYFLGPIISIGFENRSRRNFINEYLFFFETTFDLLPIENYTLSSNLTFTISTGIEIRIMYFNRYDTNNY